MENLDLEFYQTREELIRAYNPTTERQIELVNLVADSYEQLRESHRLRALVAHKGMRGLSPQEFEDYKAFMHNGLEDSLMDLRQFDKPSASAPPKPPNPDRPPCRHGVQRKPSA